MTESIDDSVAAILGLTLIVAACSSGGGTSTAPSAAPSAAASSAALGGPVGRRPVAPPAMRDLVIWADDKRAAALKPLAEQFGADNGVTVKVEAISKDIIPNFLTAAPGGHGPGHRRLGA